MIGGQMAKRVKLQKTDGLGPYEIKRIRAAIRQVWQRSHARKLCIDRATGKDGFVRCEKCKKKVPKIYVDHIEAVGEVDGKFIYKLFCPSDMLQALCKKCHDAKTKEERAFKKKLEKIMGRA